MEGMATFIKHGGFFMYVNLTVLVFVLAIAVERLVFLILKGQIKAKELLNQLRKLVQADHLDRAIRLCSATDAPLLQVAKAGLGAAPQGEEAVATAVEEALVETMPEVKKRIPALWSLANIATLVGLLGTVVGLIRAFAAVTAADPAKRQEHLAQGIAEALYNTALGLSIAVTAIMFHLLLSGMSKKVVADLELFSMRLENVLIGQLSRSVANGETLR